MRAGSPDLERVRAAVLGALLLACSAASAGTQACAREAPRAAVDRAERLPVDGARLYLLVRGRDRSAPVLVWLHGGPGGTEIPFFRLFQGALEERFAVAYYDQRGAGRSYDPDADRRLLTVARHVADLDAVVEALRRALGAPRVLLVGHSWGSALGLLYAEAHPEKVVAAVGVGQVTATRGQQAAEHAFVAEEAARRGDERALAALREIGPPPYGAREQLALERWSGRYGALFHRGPSLPWTALRAVLAGYVAPWEIPRFIRANEVSLEAMSAELLELDLRRDVRRLEVPVYFLLGRHDRHVDARLAAAYLDALEAPDKALVWFEASAHHPPFEEPERFRAVLSDLAERAAAWQAQRARAQGDAR